MEPPGDVTRLLSDWAEGDPRALQQLMPLVYNELHRIARHQWNRQSQGNTLQPTALIHEAFLKLVGRDAAAIQNRTHFFALASMAMRQVLVNHAEANLAQKRGGAKANVLIEAAEEAFNQEAKEVVDLHMALTELEKVDPRKSRVVELRYFGGLSIEETAEALQISTVTVKRDWQTARAFLARELGRNIAQ